MRIILKFLPLLLLGGFSAQRATALEVNYWPLFTSQHHEEREVYSWQSIGPIIFSEATPAQDSYGVRPFFIRFVEAAPDRSSAHLLYPLFNTRHRPYGTSWDVLNLITFQSFTPENNETSRAFTIFPILFWRTDPDPERSYFGVFPIAGQTQNFLGYDKFNWFLFPLTARLDRGDVSTYAMPWPFIRVVRGPDTRGFHLWPLYGQVAQEDVYSNRYWLWPLGYSVRRELWKEQPFEAFGFLPFYASSVSDRAVSQTFIWPFFGYTASEQPEYHETRYFWPFLVQRRGDSYVNRWAPFYTHSIRADVEKRWIMWPLHRSSNWEDRNLRNERTQFLFFLYWSNIQSSVTHPELDPAVKQHVWPFYSYWDNGAGQRQFQTLSPFEVFFPFNEVVRANYSPLFAFYRLSVEDDVRSRHSFLFNFITWNRLVEEERVRLDVGPIVSYERHPDGRAWELLKGLLSYSRERDERSFGALWLNRPTPSSHGESKLQESTASLSFP